MQHDADDNSLARSWLAALGTTNVRAELEGVYARISQAVESRRPVCETSGRCCKFEQWGHRLYVTGLEAAYTVALLGEVDQPIHTPTANASPSTRTVSLMQAGSASHHGRAKLDASGLARALAEGGCPFQVGKLCGVHPIRPLGCRVYYCDPTAQEWQQDLSEVMLADVRSIHERHDVPYRYGEWRAMLRKFLDERGRTMPTATGVS
ncbi:MAG: hypothetical protein KF768_02115 [Phycisphaeraceae bacterium]|nr:hypothetical protein [Phycisphaeraceae bacterium]